VWLWQSSDNSATDRFNVCECPAFVEALFCKAHVPLLAWFCILLGLAFICLAAWRSRLTRDGS
jgi:hypothetical protein